MVLKISCKIRIQKGKSTKTDKTDKKLIGIKRDKSGKSSSQIVPRIWNSRPSCLVSE
jgi:hypothetical protein